VTAGAQPRATAERAFRMVLEYDGTDFHGWQRQAAERTVQGELEGALATLTGGPVSVIGSGRTDAGVHALAQVAGFRCETRMAPDAIRKALDSLTGDDLAVLEVRETRPGFHARFDARGKTYEYRILNRERPSALERRYRWWIRRPLDRTAMAAALERLRGRRDFRAFEGAGSPRAHTVRELRRAEIREEGDGRLKVILSADGFLRYMVRNIVGTLAEIGAGKMPSAAVADILAYRDRSRAAATAPARGLFLVRVDYDEEEKSP
jgi:tRNA pseudouridine38-40 synthase